MKEDLCQKLKISQSLHWVKEEISLDSGAYLPDCEVAEELHHVDCLPKISKTCSHENIDYHVANW